MHRLDSTPANRDHLVRRSRKNGLNDKLSQRPPGQSTPPSGRGIFTIPCLWEIIPVSTTATVSEITAPGVVAGHRSRPPRRSKPRRRTVATIPFRMQSQPWSTGTALGVQRCYASFLTCRLPQPLQTRINSVKTSSTASRYSDASA